MLSSTAFLTTAVDAQLLATGGTSHVRTCFNLPGLLESRLIRWARRGARGIAGVVPRPALAGDPGPHWCAVDSRVGSHGRRAPDANCDFWLGHGIIRQSGPEHALG